MLVIRFFIFIIGICLINFVGGVPHDSKNLFITHLIFLAPLLLDCYGLLKITTLLLKFTVLLFYVAGIFALVANTLGILGVFIVSEDKKLLPNPDYLFIPFEVPILTYLIIVGVIYSSLFVLFVATNAALKLDKKMVKAKKIRQENKKNTERGVMSDVSG